MKCSLLTLSCALDGELSQERQAELETHLVTCERCRSGMRYLREETERISQLARAHVPPGSATAILERARVLTPEAGGSATSAPKEPDPVAVVEVPPLEDAPESAGAGSPPLPDLALWGPGALGTTVPGAPNSIAVAGFPAPGQLPEAPAGGGAEPGTGSQGPGATTEDLSAGPDEPRAEAESANPAASIEGDISPWPAGPEANPDQGDRGAADSPLAEAFVAEPDQGDRWEGSGWASPPLPDGGATAAEAAWAPGAFASEQPAVPDPGATGPGAEGPELPAHPAAQTSGDPEPRLQGGPPGLDDSRLAEPWPAATGRWDAQSSRPDAGEPQPEVRDETAALEPTGGPLDLGTSYEDSAAALWASQPQDPQPEPSPAADLKDLPAEESAAARPAAPGYPDPIAAGRGGAVPGGGGAQDPGTTMDPDTGVQPRGGGPAPGAPDVPTGNRWKVAPEEGRREIPAEPWQRSWEPEPLPVWSPTPAPSPPWAGGAPAEEEQGPGEEVMEVAKEEAAGLGEPPATTELPVWIPPPPSLPSSAADSWVPKRDLLDFPTQPAAEPLSRPTRPVDSVVPPRRPPGEEGTYQRIPPPHRPEGPGKPPPAQRPASAGPRSWTRTGTIAVAALAVFLIGWALTHHSARTPAPAKTTHSSPTPTSPHSPAASPSAPATTAPALNLTGEQTFGGGGGGYQMQTARYGLHQNGTQLWVVFQMVSGSGPPKITTGFDGATTLYVEMQGVSPGVAVPQPPPGELVTSVKAGQVPGFTGAVYILQLSRAAQVTGYLLPGTNTGSPGERVVLELQ